jgi:hypothetical protein
MVLEGISYYLPEEPLQSIVTPYTPAWTVFEFLKNDGEISSDRIEIPKKVFSLISRHCELKHIGRYSCSGVEKLFNMPVAVKYSMKQLEKIRTGSNRFFPAEESGWIEVCLLGNK